MGLAVKPARRSAALEVLTNSRLATYRRCPQEHRYRYEQGYVPVADALALRLGTLVHAGLEAWWKTTHPEERLAAAIETMREAAGELDQYELVRAEEMLLGYDVRWGGEEYEILGVELEFRAPLVNPASDAESHTWQRGGKLDVLARERATGRIVIIEHKTSSRDVEAGSTYWARLRLDSQVSMYFNGAEALGYTADAVVYDVLSKPGQRPHKATPVENRKYTKDGRLYANQREVDETPEEFRERVRASIAAEPAEHYQRGEVVRLEAEMHAYDAETWQQAVVMRDARRMGIAPKNPDSCVRYNSLCSYFAVCCGEAALDDESKFNKLDWVHQELTRPAEGTPKEKGQHETTSSTTSTD